ncbi:uncharacterized protein BT62DRAFT_338090 [Guyanagaster necrorhizus]|uniref:Uncharacterized protein n=1 Tax=Guyanagaster necrorhizus TaxID=856835 RepID=A0A9P8APS1_9AGAR|nr:uncharacterized protein BT62DRAFT_338090 [Guyanagaster necrorhizus MCA 3950]KAG7443255.1 hypothetical protein BT62DRAFT_338090 [Guyanagaster necrorhizus MCA 3950]
MERTLVTCSFEFPESQQESDSPLHTNTLSNTRLICLLFLISMTVLLPAHSMKSVQQRRNAFPASNVIPEMNLRGRLSAFVLCLL